MGDQEQQPPLKKRKRRASPSAHTLAECRKRGWIAEVVERRIPKTFISVDYINVVDIIAIDQAAAPSGIIAIQTCVATDHAKRRTKILAEPMAAAWVRAGGRLELWSWRQSKPRAPWVLRVETWDEMQSGVARGTGSSP